MDVFGNTLSSKTLKLIADGDQKLESSIKKHDELIDENRKKIANLDTALDIRLHTIETNVNKLLSTLSTLEGEIEKFNLRINYLDTVTLEDSTITITQPTTRI
jgi:predicted nuclease with TOPRIM domain